VEVEIVMKTNIEKYIIGNRKLMRMLTVTATLFFAGAVFKLTADKWPEGVIYFVTAACFASLERACVRRAGEARNNNETTYHEEDDNE
jgi:hypothetical protein